MGIKRAVVTRIKALCKQKSIKPNTLATLSSVTPSTVYSMLDENRKDIGILVLKKLCDGLDITISDFFDDDIFKSLEQEIQ
ncbi:MAG: helix-turn-helix transcriptional regulator [Clostridia bacterium]|nr:helix-turn-helix transcriptional regulator [Clostridia bacterium]